MASLTVRGITKRFGSTAVLKGIDLDLEDGAFLVLVGPSGCGKSTLLNIIAGLEDSNEGEILIDGAVVNSVAPKDRDIAMVFQSYALYPTMTVRQNITFGLRIRRIPASEQDAAVQRVAEMLKIEQLLDRKPGQLSGGQRQRVAMGRALVRDPKIFLFDEPLSNLDAKLRVEMRHEIKTLHRNLGRTAVYVTHDQVEAMTLASRIAVMDKGIVQQYGAPVDIYDHPTNIFVAGFMGAQPMNFIQGSLRGSSDGLSVQLGGDAAEAPLALPGAWQPSGAAQSMEDGRPVILGVRPEFVARAAASDAELPPGQALITPTVEMTEPMGADTMVFFSLGGASASARLPTADAPAVGDRVPLAVDMGRVSLFDPTSEMRL